MAKFHINPESGDPGECRATTEEGCPFGSANEHYRSAGEARQAYEGIMEQRSRAPRKRTLDKDIFLSVLTSSEGVLAENFAGSIREGLEPGTYSAFYYDQDAGEDRYIKLEIPVRGEPSYVRTKGFQPVSSPSSEQTQRAVSDFRTDLNGLVAKGDPSYCKRNSIDRITLLENANEFRRRLASYDWETAEGATAGRLTFEDIEWSLDHDLTVARNEGLTDEINALSESKSIVSTFLTEMTSRRS